MRRRTLLASTAATLATTAGCLSDETPRVTTEEQTQTDRRQTSRNRASRTQTAEADIPVATARVRTSIRWVHTVDAVEVSAPDEDAFVAVRVPEALRGPEPDAFELRLDDTVYQSVDNGMSWTAMPVVGEWYGRESGGSWVFFDVAATDTAAATPDRGTTPAATLVAPDGSRARVPGERLRRLAALPSFRVLDVTVPETARPESRVEVAVTVRNEGDSRGYWFGGIQWGGVFYRPTVSVAPGETGRASSDVRVSEGGISIRLRWPGEERSFYIDAPVEDTTTETPTS